MPRIRPSTILRARTIDKALPSLLPVCRDLGHARNELRWLQEHARFVSDRINAIDHHELLRDFVARRAGGEPLQYILGSECFGDLEIKCRPGVLIPRPETAASVSHLAKLIRPRDKSKPLRVLDLCTGSGCIPLLFHDEFYKDAENENQHLELVGVDISSEALSLARENVIHQIARNRSRANSVRTSSLNRIGFVQADILRDEECTETDSPPSLTKALQRLSDTPNDAPCDILISNPPYISSKSFVRTTARSVRHFEPRLALVPPEQVDMHPGDAFYPKLLRIAASFGAKIILFEVADMDQAERVAAYAIAQDGLDCVEIWRDEPGHQSLEEARIADSSVIVRGRGHGRSVLAWRKDAAALFKGR